MIWGQVLITGLAAVAAGRRSWRGGDRSGAAVASARGSGGGGVGMLHRPIVLHALSAQQAHAQYRLSRVVI